MSVDGRPEWLKAAQPFLLGGFAGCIATICIQPIDLIKVRIQLAGEYGGAVGSKNPIAVGLRVIREEGVGSLYKGLDAGLIRQVSYTTVRLGLFRVMLDCLRRRNGNVNLTEKALAGLIAGGVGSIVGTPADLTLIRLQSDATLPFMERRNYKNVFDAFRNIIAEDGILGLWRGSLPTVTRAMALNMGMLASYDQSQEILQRRFGQGLATNIMASAIAGWFAVTFSLPFDLVKTRIQKMTVDPHTGRLPYRGFVDCAVKTLTREGPLGFYSGYSTYYLRIAPHAMITLVAMEYGAKILQSAYGKNP